MSVVFLCPGQGQVPRDLGDLVRASGDDLAAAFEARLGPEAFDDPLADYARQQAALVAIGVGRARRALEVLAEPEHAATFGEVVGVAGHSLGEITALFVAGALDGPGAVRLAAERGQAVQDARVPEWEEAGMLALSGPTVHDHIEALLAEHGVELANDNAGDQLVAVGRSEALAALGSQARELGLRAVRLETTGPSHSSYMLPVVAPLADAVHVAGLTEPRIPFWSGLTARRAVDPPTEIGRLIAERVRWRETLLDLVGVLHPTHFLDIGPGGAMARLARKTVPEVAAHTLDELDP
ncbi:MAG: ACP S-malonyltransferase [Solirubrobacteraceae bacterium]|nr:ACP S-malonyltransferase [Solirubrobacteraceae bacterium]